MLYSASERGSTDQMNGKSWECGFAAEQSDAEKLAYLRGWQSSRGHERICELTSPYDDYLPDWVGKQIEQDGLAGLLPREAMSVAPKQPVSSVRVDDLIFVDADPCARAHWASVERIDRHADVMAEHCAITYAAADHNGRLALAPTSYILVLASSATA